MAISFFKKKEEEKVSILKKELNSSLKQVKEELEEHLDTINDNTNEIQSNYSFSCDIEAKIDKLNQRIDEVQLLLQNFTKTKEFVVDNPNFSQPLSVPEREVFLVLYTTENAVLSYKTIADGLNLTESIARQLIFNLIGRGIPIVKEYKQGKAHVRLDKDFKELQAKENILKIDQTTLQKFQFAD